MTDSQKPQNTRHVIALLVGILAGATTDRLHDTFGSNPTSPTDTPAPPLVVVKDGNIVSNRGEKTLVIPEARVRRALAEANYTFDSFTPSLDTIIMQLHSLGKEYQQEGITNIAVMGEKGKYSGTLRVSDLMSRNYDAIATAFVNAFTPVQTALAGTPYLSGSVAPGSYTLDTLPPLPKGEHPNEVERIYTEQARTGITPQSGSFSERETSRPATPSVRLP